MSARERRRRIAFAGVAYAFTATMLGTTLPTPLYALYRQRFSLSELTITVIFATYAVGVIAALMLFGRLSDEIGRRRTLLPGLACSALSSAAFLLAHGLALLLVGRLLSGLSAGIFTGTATAALVDLAAEGRRERATLVATVANMGGLGLGPLIAGLLLQWVEVSMRLVFWVDLGLLVLAAIGVWLIGDSGAPSGSIRLRPQALSVPTEIRATFVRAALAGFAGFAVLGLFTAVSPAFLVGVLHEPGHARLGLTVFAVFLASTLGQLGLAVVPERAALPGGCAGLVVAMGVLAAGLAAGSFALLLGGGVLAGLGQGLSFRAGLAAVNAGTPEDRRGEVASSFFVVAYVALSIPVIGEGILAEVAGLRAAGLVFTGAVALLAGVVLVMLGVRAREGQAA